MAAILGISAFYHDSAAAMLIDGEIVAAAQEERFSRRKHDERFPSAAIKYCLDATGIRPENLDYVAFYEKPLLKFDRLLETYLAYAPAGLSQFLEAMPIWLKIKLHLAHVIRKELGAATGEGSFSPAITNPTLQVRSSSRSMTRPRSLPWTVSESGRRPQSGAARATGLSCSKP